MIENLSKKYNTSLKKKILLWVFITNIIIVILLTLSSFRVGYTNILKESNQKLEYLLESEVNSFEKHIEEMEKIVSVLELEVTKTVKSNQIHNEDHLADVISQMNPIVKLQAQYSSMAQTAYFYINPYLTNNVYDVYYVDQNKDGIVELQENIPIEYYDPSTKNNPDKAWWFGPIETKEEFWTLPYIWEVDNGKPIKFISYTKPIYINGELFSIVGTDIRYSIIDNAVGNVTDYKSSYTFLLTESLEVLKYTDNKIPKEMYDKIKQSDRSDDTTIFSYISKNNVKKIVVVSELNNGWVYGIEVDEREIYEGLSNFIVRIVILLVIFFVVVLLVARRFSHQISNPILEIYNSMQKFSRNSQEIQFKDDIINRSDELGILAYSIEQMSKKIEFQISALSKKNSELNREILLRKSAETELALMFEIISDAKDSIFIIDDKYNIVFVNKAYMETTGYKGEKLEGKKIFDKGVQIPSDIVKILEIHGSWAGELSQITKEGLEYPIQLFINSSEQKNYYFAIFKDITNIKEQEEYLDYLSKYDSNTNLPNREYFIDLATGILTLNEKRQNSGMLLLINIDNFRLFNEVFGVKKADVIIKKISIRLKEIVSSFDDAILSRFEGDEFAILMSGKNDIINFVEEIFESFNEPVMIDKEYIYVNMSIGIAEYPNDAQNIKTLIKNSKSALNYVKANQKNDYQFYSDQIDKISSENYDLIKKLRHAIDNGELSLRFQPQINAKDKKVEGVESLLRWKNDGEFISPYKFISLAEKSNLIIPIGEWVLEESISYLSKLHMAGYKVSVSVNLSAEQLRKDYIVPFIKSLIKKYDVDPNYLELEVTENVLLLNKEEVYHIIQELRQLGIGMAIDDFGTGYSSIGYLKYYNFDKIKLDREFVKDIPAKDNGDFAKLIIDLAHSLGSEIITEGIETQEQLEFIVNSGCHLIQGYYFSKPLEFDALLEFIANYY